LILFRDSVIVLNNSFLGGNQYLINKKSNDYFDGKYFPQYSIVFEGNHSTKIPPYGGVPEQLVIISPGSTFPFGNVALPRITMKLSHVKFPLTSVTINVLFSCLKIIGEGFFPGGVNQFPRMYPAIGIITKKTTTTRTMTFIPFFIFFAPSIITIHIVIKTMRRELKKNPIESENTILEIISPMINNTIAIVEMARNFFSILFTPQEQCFIINFFWRLSVNEK